MDKLPVYSTEIQWSLIYRKLKGKRGCTPLLPWEADRLINMIRNQNNGTPIASANFIEGLGWDLTNRRIIVNQNRQNYPYPRDYNFNILGRICDLMSSRRAYEVYLQLYFTENIGFDQNLNLIIGDNLIWFGNEVACGVGMQKIDILTICQNGDRREYRLIELKDEAVQPEVVNQIEYYVNWASQNCGRHLENAFNWNIQPVIVAPVHNQRNWSDVVNAFNRYNQKQLSLPILYFEFNVDCDTLPRNIVFNQVNY